MALEPTPTADPGVAEGLAGLSRPLAWLWLAMRVAGSVVTVPVAEELAFRGYLTRRLISVDFTSVPLGRFSWPSLMISSAAFGMLHGRWLAGMLVGVLYALALYRKGKLGDSVLGNVDRDLLVVGIGLS